MIRADRLSDFWRLSTYTSPFSTTRRSQSRAWTCLSQIKTTRKPNTPTKRGDLALLGWEEEAHHREDNARDKRRQQERPLKANHKHVTATAQQAETSEFCGVRRTSWTETGQNRGTYTTCKPRRRPHLFFWTVRTIRTCTCRDGDVNDHQELHLRILCNTTLSNFKYLLWPTTGMSSACPIPATTWEIHNLHNRGIDHMYWSSLGTLLSVGIGLCTQQEVDDREELQPRKATLCNAQSGPRQS